jgi:hypothetical protein
LPSRRWSTNSSRSMRGRAPEAHPAETIIDDFFA